MPLPSAVGRPAERDRVPRRSLGGVGRAGFGRERFRPVGRIGHRAGGGPRPAAASRGAAKASLIQRPGDRPRAGRGFRADTTSRGDGSGPKGPTAPRRDPRRSGVAGNAGAARRFGLRLDCRPGASVRRADAVLARSPGNDPRRGIGRIAGAVFTLRAWACGPSATAARFKTRPGPWRLSTCCACSFPKRSFDSGGRLDGRHARITARQGLPLAGCRRPAGRLEQLQSARAGAKPGASSNVRRNSAMASAAWSCRPRTTARA